MASIFSVGYYQFDEHFQILEFAGLKLNLTSVNNLPWEFHHQIRASIQPVIAVYVYRFWGLFGFTNPFFIALLLRLLSASISFVSMWMLYKVYNKKIKDQVLSKWFLILSFLLWFAIFNNVRFSSENWSGTFFIIAFALFFLRKRDNFLYYMIIGTLLGFSFLFRYQVGFLIAGFLLWIVFIKKEKPLNIAYLISGISIIIFLGILLDKWFYGEWTFTAWNYFDQNILQNKVSSFGVHPWWYYIETFFIQAIPPFSLLFLVSIIYLIIFDRKNPIVWTILPFLVVHFIIGHKEMRFLFPIIGFLPIVVIKSLELIKKNHFKTLLTNRPFLIFMKGFFIVNFLLLLIVTFQSADGQIGLYQSIYSKYKTPTTLFYVDRNPYDRVLNIQFYKRKNLEILQAESIDSIEDQFGKTNLIVFTNHNIPSGFDKNNRLVYSSFPVWINKINFYNWVDRINIWYVYEIGNEPQPISR